jgi:hypothetical protein
MSVWFTKPAKSYHEAAAVGNGRLGAMDFGGVHDYRIVLNESSMWSGGPYDSNRPDAHACLPDVRSRLFDGNFGGCAAVGEMIIQSHDGTITLLPALPAAWKYGKATGLRARGDFTVDLEWRDGKVTDYRITSPVPREVKVRVNGETKAVRAGISP